ncbi:MAG TPA: FAD-binding oxidoreductase [Solirubrobacteraceae bacterium]
MLTTEQIETIRPGDDRYEEARAAWNLAADLNPAVVAYPNTADDVAAIVAYAREHGLRVTAQGTGHNATPHGDLSDTVLIKTERLRGVEIDADARRARAEAGAVWSDVTGPASEHGLAPLSGSSPNVGVVGYFLGGGVSLGLARAFGVAANSVLAFEVVTADGRLRRVDADNDPDLFWALRGGGGSYAIVTAVEFALYAVPELYGGVMLWPADRAREVLEAWVAFTRTAPDAFTSTVRVMNVPDMPEIPEPVRGRQLVAVDGVYAGPAEEGAALTAPLRALGPELDGFGPLPPVALSYVHMDPEDPMAGRSDSQLLDDVTPATVDRILDVAAPTPDSPLVMVELRHLGGAVARRPEGAGVIGSFEAPYLAFAVGPAFTPELTAAVEASLALLRDALAPQASGREYLNFAEGRRDPSAFFGDEDLARLRAVKARVDPNGAILANHPV